MTTPKFVYIIAGFIVLSASIPFEANSFNTAALTIAQTIQKQQPKRPPTKTTTIKIEGEKTPVNLKLYQQDSPRFSTYVPEDFIVETSAAGEGTSARFIANFGGTRNDQAYVHFFFPAQAMNLNQIRPLVTGKRGLLANNKWQVVRRNTNIPYRWVKERIFFKQRQGNQNFVGSVLIGENRGKAFHVITHYPAEYGDGFDPRANLILQNTQFN